MTYCDECRAIRQGEIGAPGHVGLRITDTQRRKLSKARAVTISTFVCGTCGATWVYRDRPDGNLQGWTDLQTLPADSQIQAP
ncbi:hypothetical protein [Cupriavidus sp. RAF12]|uniref:hypothetical protein n=1 Tax=Cupriavidus sp. RAF12 TaxID=3233050 RepID=UPI003F93DE65